MRGQFIVTVGIVNCKGVKYGFEAHLNMVIDADFVYAREQGKPVFSQNLIYLRACEMCPKEPYALLACYAPVFVRRFWRINY